MKSARPQAQNRSRPLSRPVLAGALACSLLASGCGVVTQLHADDKSAPSATVRVLHRLGGGPGGGGVELELSSVRGEGSQRLEDLTVATLGGRAISGPTQLLHTVRVQHAQLVYNHRLFAGRPFELEWFAGAASVRTDWRSVSTNPADPSLSRQITWRGPAGGALGRVRLGPLLALEGRLSGAIALSGGTVRGGRSAAELALAFRPVPSLVLRGGLAEMRSDLSPREETTELSTRLRGPFLNLGVEF